MQVPAEFRHLAQCFYQGSHEEVSSLEEWAALALQHLNNSQRKVVRKFLDEILRSDPSAVELQRIWAQTSADYYFTDDQLRSLLSSFKKQLEL